MTLREYYGFPEGLDVDMTYIPHWLADKPNFPIPSQTQYLFSRLYNPIPLVNTSNVRNMSSLFDNAFITTMEGTENWDTSNCTNMNNMFYYCRNLTDISAMANWNTSNVTNMDALFSYAQTLKNIDAIGGWDVSNVTSMKNLCSNTNVNSAEFIRNWDTSNCTNMHQIFYNTGAITSIPYINCINVDKDSYPVYSYSDNNNLTDLGGFYMKNSWVNTYGLVKCPKLTVESLVNVLNALYDFTGNSETPNSNQGKLALGATNLAKLTDEQKAIATNKGWTLS